MVLLPYSGMPSCSIFLVENRASHEDFFNHKFVHDNETSEVIQQIMISLFGHSMLLREILAVTEI
jgi:hypothetical protein